MPAAELPLTEQEAFRDMYEMGSLFTTQDAGMCFCYYMLLEVCGNTVSIAGCIVCDGRLLGSLTAEPYIKG